MSHLLEPWSLRGVSLRNRIGMSPMCTYSAVGGYPQAWHLVHLGSRACGGAGLILTEATAVEPRGRISPADCGLWEDGQIDAWKPIVRFVHEQGTVLGIQIAHAGRKAGTRPPWKGRGSIPEAEGGWRPVGPSAVPFSEEHPVPAELSAKDLRDLIERWAEAARRAARAGFRVLEIHMAHGYLLHQFLSPLVNLRSDAYGGSLENRMRFPLEVARSVRAAWPEEFPLLVRMSVTDWAPRGWDVDSAAVLAGRLREEGVDCIDCSSGGAVRHQEIPVAPGFQVPFAERLRREVGIATGAVGMIRDPRMADEIVREGRADLVLLGRELLRDPYWPLRAAEALGESPDWPDPYGWAVR